MCCQAIISHMEWVQACSFVLLGDCLKELWVCLTCFDSPDVAIVGICGDSVANGHLAAVLATKCPAEHEERVASLWC